MSITERLMEQWQRGIYRHSGTFWKVLNLLAKAEELRDLVATGEMSNELCPNHCCYCCWKCWDDTEMPLMKMTTLNAILTDVQFWVPVVVLAMGILLLAFLH
jgi:hypothetical protein